MKVFTNHLIEGVTGPADRALLTRIFIDKEAGAEGGIGSLSPEGTTVYRLLKGTSLDEVQGLVEQLSPKTLDFLRDISPSAKIDRLKARVLIMHDRGDRLVPSEESRRLAEGLGKGSDTYHTEFSSFQREIQVHEDESQGVGPLGYAREAFKLFLHMYKS